MRINKLASAILKGNWLIDPRIAAGMMPVVFRFLEGQPVAWYDEDDEEDDTSLLAYFISPEGLISKVNRPEGSVSSNLFDGAPEGSIAVIPIMGTIMKDDYCGSPGTDTMSSWLRDARDAQTISGAILHINSGGGSVEGTGEFASLIKQVDQVKPVIAYTDGLMASAAYWLGSSAREIIASYETVEIGSIGTAIRFMDFSKMYKDKGIEEHYINADASIDKNQDYYKALKGDYTDIRNNILNPTNDVFLNNVRTNRDGKLKLTSVKAEDGNTYDEPLTGKVYLAKKAIENGLIDSIGSLDEAINKVLSHTEQSLKNASITTNNDTMKFGNPFKKLSATKGKKAEDVSLEELNEINAELESNGVSAVAVVTSDVLTEAENNETAIGDAVAQINTALSAEGDKAHTTLSAAVAALVADRDAERTRAEEFGEQPGEVPTKPVSKKAEEGGELLDPKKVSFETTYDKELQELNKIK